MCRFMRVSRYARLARFARLHSCETMRPPHDSRLSWGIRIMGVISCGDGPAGRPAAYLWTSLGGLSQLSSYPDMYMYMYMYICENLI